MAKETGPIYNVPLIEILPLRIGGMTQAMPSRRDLENMREVCGGQRVVAGYEVLLFEWRREKAITHVLAEQLTGYSTSTVSRELGQAAEIVDEAAENA